ncbi:hypothetical protein NIES4102_18410 [Chondrocystis sp. NIES-4102]|nr:hypothetical protein NIES4102_18410 [Chondrocystis sp. NIES-4102]
MKKNITEVFFRYFFSFVGLFSVITGLADVIKITLILRESIDIAFWCEEGCILLKVPDR